jgi:hypothetical protein
MSNLADIADAVERYNRSVEKQVRAARQDPKLRAQVLERWQALRDAAGTAKTPTSTAMVRRASSRS